MIASLFRRAAAPALLGVGLGLLAVPTVDAASATAVSSSPTSTSAAAAPRIRVTLRGGQKRDLHSLRKLADGRVRMKLVEGGTVEVDAIWILDWEYSAAYLAELAIDGVDFPDRCDPHDSPRIARWGQLIDRAAAKHDLEPSLVAAVLAVESCGDPSAVSSAGALGLMQLMPATAADLGCTDPLDAAANVDAGCRHLRRVLLLFDDDLELGLAAYHAGEGAVARYGRIPPYPSTQRYVRTILSLLAR